MRVGLYVQNLCQKEAKIKEEYERILCKAAENQLDLFIFPEHAWCPGVEEYERLKWTTDTQEIIESTLDRIVSPIMNKTKCAVIFNHSLADGNIMSTFYDKSGYQCYFKHIATYFSPFSYEDYEENILRSGEDYRAIEAEGFSLGMTICYDSTNPLLNRIWGMQNVDIIANSTGGHVDYKKWTYYQKARAIENNCFTVCTMACYEPNKKNSSYAMGFDPWGRAVTFENTDGKIRSGRKFPEQKGELYVAELDLALRERTPAQSERDEYMEQDSSVNKKQDLFLDPVGINKELDSCRNLAMGLYVKLKDGINLVYVVVEGRAIYRPEWVQSLFYSPLLKDVPNKRYILINRWGVLEKNEYECFLSTILRVRAAENYCACLLMSNTTVQCFQVGKNKNSQIVALSKHGFGIDLSRTTGPEAIWKTKAVGVRGEWRANYEKMVQYCMEVSPG